MPNYDRRWYDRDAGCQGIVEQIEKIAQPEIREFCARILIHYCERIRTMLRARTGDNHLELGLSGLQSLYLAKKEHRRWYDQEPVLQKSFGSLYSLSNEGLYSLSSQLIDTVRLIALYGFIYGRMDQKPTKEDMMNITKTSLNEGKEAGETLVADIVGKDLYDSLMPEFQG